MGNSRLITSILIKSKLFTNMNLKKKLLLFGVIVFIGIVGFFAAQAIVSYNKGKENGQQVTSNAVVESYKQQLSTLSQTVDQNLNDPIAHKNYAVALYATGDLQKAYDQYQEAIKLDSSNPTLYNNFGNVARDLGKYEDSVSAYQKAISLNPKAIDSYTNLANLYIFTLGKIDLGIEVFKNALASNPGNVDLQIQLAIAYEQQLDFNEATIIYKEILKTNPGNLAAIAGLERVRISPTGK